MIKVMTCLFLLLGADLSVARELSLKDYRNAYCIELGNYGSSELTLNDYTSSDHDQLIRNLMGKIASKMKPDDGLGISGVIAQMQDDAAKLCDLRSFSNLNFISRVRDKCIANCHNLPVLKPWTATDCENVCFKVGDILFKREEYLKNRPLDSTNDPSGTQQNGKTNR